MKNIIKYIGLPSLAIIVFLFVAVNYGQRLRFGDAWFENDTANKILTNKSLYFESGDSIYYNNVVVTSGTGGGGIAASDNTTFTGINTFTDSLRANGYSIIDDAKITSYLRVTGEVTTDLNFNKGSSTSIGTISTDSLAFITNDTNRIVIDKNGYTVFTDTVQMLDRVYISGNLNVASNIYTIGNITADSIAGIGRFITEVDAITLKGQDTTHFAHTDTLTTERVKSKTEFSDIVTFFLSPVFSALVTFANGITVTGTATFNGDLVPTSWVKDQSSNVKDQYVKEKFIRLVISSSTGAGVVSYVLHGLSKGSIRDASIMIKDDSSGYKCYGTSTVGMEIGAWNQGIITTWGSNDTAFFFRRTSNAYNYIGDTAWFHVWYADTTRN